MSRYIDIETIKPRQYENSEVELGVLAYDYDEVDAMPFLDIVLCEDCKKAKSWKCPFYRAGYTYKADDYCSDGERKEE